MAGATRLSLQQMTAQMMRSIFGVSTLTIEERRLALDLQKLSDLESASLDDLDLFDLHPLAALTASDLTLLAKATPPLAVRALQEVREGLDRDEFVMHYQPIVSVTPHRLTGFEALVRWNHPTRGVLAPDAFRGAFADPEVGALLCEAALDTALAQMCSWLDQGLDAGRVSVNLSPAQLGTPGLADMIFDRLELHGICPDRLGLELNDGALVADGLAAEDAIRRLHRAGVLVALDGFGAARASFANLRGLPINQLKIDRKFVQNAADRPIVQAAIAVGASLGVSVVATGVEDHAQRDFLISRGCNEMQGYLYGGPMPGWEASALLGDFIADDVSAAA